ncbi:phosphate acetyltransferase [Buchnera aphidicola]|uniref:phosphate acetyltransferase n=1 Tax=Buchnera aphidicola TaxID=9 RepID=UPI0031B877A9
MVRKIILIPIGKNKNLTSCILNLSNIFIKNNKNFSFFNPFIETQSNLKQNIKNSSYYLKKKNEFINFIKPLFIKNFSILLKKKNYSLYLEKLLDNYYLYNNKKIVLIEGIQFHKDISINFFNQLNLDIARILNAEIIFIITPENDFFEDLKYKFHFIKNFFLKNNYFKVLGVFINSYNKIQLNYVNNTNKLLFYNNKKKIYKLKNFIYKNILILGIFYKYKYYFSIKLEKLISFLNAQILFYKKKNKKINYIVFFSNQNINKIYNFKKNVLLVIPLNYFDNFKKIIFLKKKCIQCSLLFIGNNKSFFIHSKIYKRLKKNGISIFFLNINLLNLLYHLHQINYLYHKKCKKTEYKKNSFILFSNINSIFLSKKNKVKKFSSYKFLYKLKKLSKKQKKTIILPEGENLKIIKAAYLCHKFNICNCLLIGNLNEIHKKFFNLGLSIPKNLKIYDPKDISKNYIKICQKTYNNLIIYDYKKFLEKNTIILSMFILMNTVKFHGIVAGIENTTADVIRPALKIVKMKKNVSLISSIFFMLFPDKVFIYGDCAINPNPNEIDLSEIAIQSADSAQIFGITPKIAMLSYSTNNSGSGLMVDKIRIATELVKKKRPDLIVEGPIQYDAAIDKNISKIKFSKSIISGDANIFIFPDLNSGNITYKAVQRSCSIFSLGPMIQGLKKPVNDLSRGASTEDILYTIALTVIQSID